MEATGDERDRGSELEEIQGFHLEQAYRYREELAPVDATTRILGEHAAEKLRSAGLRALDRGDMPAAANLLAHTGEAARGREPRQAPILIAAGNALHETGAIDDAVAAFDAADRAAVMAADRWRPGTRRASSGCGCST